MGWAFCGGLRGRRDLFCLRRGTFPAQEKCPKARQNQGFGILFRPTGEVPAGRCPHRPERRNHAPKIPHISVGAGVHDGPSKSTPHLYISHRQRQRRRSRDDSTFYAPCKFLQTCGTHYNKHPVCGARKGFLNRRFKRRFFAYFLPLPAKSMSPKAHKAAPPHPLTDAARMPYNIP